MMKNRGKMLVSILLGNVLLAFSVCAFIIPNRIMLGGSTGITLTVQHWIPVSLSSITAVTNTFLFGLGLVIRAGGSTGGMDIPPCILQKYRGIPVGTSMMVFDILVVLMQISYSGANGILYSVVIILLSSFMVNKTVTWKWNWNSEKKIDPSAAGGLYYRRCGAARAGRCQEQ